LRRNPNANAAVLWRILTQLDIPIRKVNEVLPTIVPLQAEVDLHERTPFGPFGFADEMHSGFLRRAVGLPRVTLDAGADDVFPSRRTAAVARDDVIQIQIFSVELVAAVLAGVFIALKNVVARELDFLFGQPVINQQQDDSRHTNTKGDGMNRFFVRRVFGEIPPFVEIKRAERAIIGVDDNLRVALKEKRERAAGGADIDSLPQPVQNKHVLVQRDIHGAREG
jgi:hypothetical protein